MPSSTTYTDDKPQVDTISAASDKVELNTITGNAPQSGEQPYKIDKQYWIRVLDDAERGESAFRKRGRDIVSIYRNEHGASGTGKARKGVNTVTFNILFANTETMLPAIYQQPPEPIVRSRFTSPDKSPMMGHNGGPPMLPPGAMPPPGLDPAAMAPMAPPPDPSGKPSQKTIEAAASVMEKALEIVVDDEQSHESVKAAIKDVLLPGRGVCRVRWKPHLKEFPVTDEAGEPALDPEGKPQVEERKVWEEVSDEYVYWEDLLIDPVRAPGDTDWIAFRHLFTEKALIAEFKGNEEFDKLLASDPNAVRELCKWTEESAAKDTVGGGSAIKTANKLGDVIKKAMVWEIWDRQERRIIWFIRDSSGICLRVDPDTYQLQGFYPIPRPMLAVTTTDTQIPRAFYDLYSDLAADLDETSRRISNLTKQIKVRGGYNSASKAIADLLTADDQKMLPVDGVDMLNGGLSNHIWLVPILEFMNALKELYNAREQIKQAIYEIMGISDIMRGATKASETATAQRIKGSMGMVRLADQKQQAGNFVRDLLRMKGELIAQNFDKETLAKMTGEDVTDEVMAVLRSDFQRTCSIDIESDSTVSVDAQEEQQSMAQVMQSVNAVMTGASQMLGTGILPPNQVIMLSLELLKMFLHPVRFSRGVVELVDDFIEQLQAQVAAQALMPPAPPPVPGATPTGNGAAPPGPPSASGQPGGLPSNGAIPPIQ